jgi:hypothetical protein
MAFRTVFFQVNRSILLKLFDESPFGVPDEPYCPNHPPAATFVEVLKKSAILGDELPLRFGFRFDASLNWIDQSLVSTLTLLIPVIDPSNPVLHAYGELSNFFERKNPPTIDLQRVKEYVQILTGPWDVRNLSRSLQENCEDVGWVISDGIKGGQGMCPRLDQSWDIDVRSELRKLDTFLVQSQKMKHRFQKNLISQRNSPLFRGLNYHRDERHCVSFCPFKLKPTFGLQFGFLQGRAVQTDEKRTGRSKTDLGGTFHCQLIRPKKILNGQMWFSPLEAVLAFPEWEHTWYLQFREIRHIFGRRYCQANTALEIFLRDGSSFLLDFAPVENSEVLEQFEACEFESLDLADLTVKWQDSKVSNFHYLMSLNVLAGRTFHDLAQYPIFPNLFAHRDLAEPIRSGLDSPFPPSVVERLLFKIEPFMTQHCCQQGKVDPSATFDDDLTKSELPPEFYFQPEVIQGHEESPSHFVYCQRKLLETSQVSGKLHHWIDLIFGSRQSEAATVNANMPLQLFSELHPSRVTRRAGELGMKTYSCSSAPLIFAGRMGHDIWLIDTSGVIRGVRVENHRLCPVDTIDGKVATNSVLSLTENGVLSYEPRIGELIVLGNKGRIKAELPGVDSLATSGDLFVVVRNRSVITLFNVNSFPNEVAKIVAVEEVVQCLAISEAFHLLCAATRDDRLHYFSLHRLHQTAVFKMPVSSPRRIVITPAWGVVAVDSGRVITLFSVNGESVGAFTHDCQFAYWTAVSSREDFDFVVCTDLKGSLFVFEAYRPSNAQTLAQLSWPVCFIDYDKQADYFVVVSTTGEVVLIQHPFIDLT